MNVFLFSTLSVVNIMLSLQPFSHLESASPGQSSLAGSTLQGLLQRSALWRDLNWGLHKFGWSLGQPTCTTLTRRVSMLCFSFKDICKCFCSLLPNTHLVWEVVTTFPVFILNYFCHIFSPFHHLPNIKYSYYLFLKSQERTKYFTNSNEENSFPQQWILLPY